MKLPRSRERDVQKAVLAYLRMRGAWAERFNSGGFEKGGQYVRFNTAVGCSDVLACFRGRLLALEVKRDRKGKATVAQGLFLEAVRAAGGVGAVVTGIDDVRAILDRIDADINGTPEVL